MNVLQKIFNDNFDEIKYTLYLRKCELKNIEKIIYCGNPPLGGSMYGCPHYSNLKFVPSDATAFSVLLVVINMPWKELPRCPRPAQL